MSKLKKLRSIIKEEVIKLREFRRPPRNSNSILPIGVVNLKTGESKYFNIYDTWADSYVNIFKNIKNKFVGVASAGKGSGKLSQKTGGLFHHDQSGRDLGRWQYVEEIPIKDRDTLAKKYKRLSMFTYK